MYNDEEKLLKFIKSTGFCLIIMLLGSFLEWEPLILMMLALIYLKED
jgi:hypothetical protein